MKNLLHEFREFAVKGNVVDMAVGIVIGVAFGKIVSSFVADVVMPPLGLMIGGVDFSDLVITLQAAQDGVAEITLRYGLFLRAIVDFIVIAFAVFIAVKTMNTVQRRFEAPVGSPPAAAPELSAEVKLLSEIRDLLKQH